MEINKVEIVEEVNDIDWGLEAIDAPYAWEKTKGEGVKIVVIDSGLDTSHPDIADNIKFQYSTIEKSYDVSDYLGHGTHVAGLIVGRYTGVAPMAELHVIKALNDNGHGTTADVMDGISYAINIEADILSISLGAPYKIPLILEQRIVDAYERGITIVSAVGNDGNYQSLYPARLKEVIGVGGYDSNFELASFSNREYNVLAPSINILSTYKDGKYARMSGTSFASPLVAGGIALLISHYRNQGKELTPQEIMNMVSGKFNLKELIDKSNK